MNHPYHNYYQKKIPLKKEEQVLFQPYMIPATQKEEDVKEKFTSNQHKAETLILDTFEYDQELLHKKPKTPKTLQKYIRFKEPM